MTGKMATNENKTTEQIIIAAAKEVFVEKGYAETNMSDIAAKAGINRPALHYYFRTKERMLEAVYSDIVLSLIPKVVQILQNDCDPFFERVSKLIDIYFGVLVENPNLPMFGIREIYRDAKYLFDTFISVSDNRIKQIKDVLLAEMEKGHIKIVPIEFILYTFYGLLFTPFLLQPMTSLVFDKPQNLTLEDLAPWKVQILTQLKTLLSVS